MNPVRLRGRHRLHVEDVAPPPRQAVDEALAYTGARLAGRRV